MHPKHTTPLQNKTRHESLGSSIWSFETLMFLLNPAWSMYCTPYLLEDSCYWTPGLCKCLGASLFQPRLWTWKSLS